MNKKQLILIVALIIVAGIFLLLSPKSQLYFDSRGIPEAHIKLFGWHLSCDQESILVQGWDESTQSFKPVGSMRPRTKGEERALPYMLDGVYHPVGWCDYISCSKIDFRIGLDEMVYTGDVESPKDTGNTVKQLIPSYKIVPLTSKAKVDIEYFRLPFCAGPKGHYSKVFTVSTK